MGLLRSLPSLEGVSVLAFCSNSPQYAPIRSLFAVIGNRKIRESVKSQD